jgi:(p)ppGpp synthase/HD superfamily hydrolase
MHFFSIDENTFDNTPSFYNPLITNSIPTKVSQMPAWLRISQAHLVHKNLEILRQAMLNSIFTENEILKVTFAIQEAAAGDNNKIAGAAEFCTIMVETMEMGLNALVAAAFHYSFCVNAREQSCLSPDKNLSPWENRQPHGGIESFGEHAVQIERDASRLKRLEMVASMVIHNPLNSHRVTPDSEGAVNLRNLFLTESKDWRALAIRGAACLYRLRGILNNTHHHTSLTKENNRACREALKIYAPLASRLGMHRLKNELEEAAFRILYPRQYNTVTSLLHQARDSQNINLARRVTPSHSHGQPYIGQSMEKILAQVQMEMAHILENDPEFSFAVQDFTVTARVKEAYSTWKKMLRNDFDHILQVPDAIALRVVLNAKKAYEDEPDEVIRARERALCYYAQELCLQRWAPSSPESARFKDYIAKPKENGYQSLHYTATTNWQGEEWSMEIQVRSEEMHNVAEFGVASHWEYKTRGMHSKQTRDAANSAEGHSAVTIDEHFGRVVIQQTSDAYLRSLQEYHWQTHGKSFEQDADPSTLEPHDYYGDEEANLRAERIRARTQRLAPYIEALTTAQSDLQRENVYVFLSELGEEAEGAVLALPAGSVVLDFLRQIELSFLPEDSIFHNGSPASLTSRLKNGDVLSIPAMMTTSMA